MAVFKGPLSLAGDATSVATDLDVGPDRLIVRAGGVVIGDWRRACQRLCVKGVAAHWFRRWGVARAIFPRFSAEDMEVR